MTNTTPILNNLYETGAISSRTMSIFYYPDPDFGELSAGGEIFFDGYDPSYMAHSEFSYLPVQEVLFWTVPLNEVWFGNLSLSIPNVTNLTAYPYFNGSLSPNRVLFDSGTSGIVFPTNN